MANPAKYVPVFSEDVARPLPLSRKKQRQICRLAQQLASQPLIRSDYTLTDESGRPIDYPLMGDFVFSYWLDHAVREVRITDIEDAS